MHLGRPAAAVAHAVNVRDRCALAAASSSDKGARLALATCVPAALCLADLFWIGRAATFDVHVNSHWAGRLDDAFAVRGGIEFSVSPVLGPEACFAEAAASRLDEPTMGTVAPARGGSSFWSRAAGRAALLAALLSCEVVVVPDFAWEARLGRCGSFLLRVGPHRARSLRVGRCRAVGALRADVAVVQCAAGWSSGVGLSEAHVPCGAVAALLVVLRCRVGASTARTTAAREVGVGRVA